MSMPIWLRVLSHLRRQTNKRLNTSISSHKRRRLSIESLEERTVPSVTLISSDSSGGVAHSYSFEPSLSADGRYVAFRSHASNLVPGDTNGYADIFRKDLLTGEILRVSTSSSNTQGNFDSVMPSISADGRYVVFASYASNLIPGDTNDRYDIFRKDVLTGELLRVSTSALNAQSDGDSLRPSISADGRFVGFDSSASNLVPNDTNATSDIFRKDMVTGAVERVSTSAANMQGDKSSVQASISADGRYVSFYSNATNLVGGDTNGRGDIFRKDLLTGELVRVSTSAAGGQSNNNSYESNISPDGRYIVFSSSASNLVPGDTNNSEDIFRKDMETGDIIRVSTSATNEQANSYSYRPVISADGRYVAFTSPASNLVGNAPLVWAHIYRKDLQTGEILRITGNPVGNNHSFQPSISADGQRIAFWSYASNLVPNDGNFWEDVFVWTSSTLPIVSTPDLIPDSDSGLSDSDNITNAETLVFSGTADFGSTVRLWHGATLLGSMVVPITGTYSFTVTDLPEGEHLLHATATNTANNTSVTDAVMVVIDRTAPSLWGGPVIEGGIKYTGWVNYDVTIEFEASDDLSGLIAYPESEILGEGANQSVTRTVTDLAGNSTTYTVEKINVDKTLPTADILSGPPAVTTSTSALFDLLGMDALSGLSSLQWSLDGSEFIGVKIAKPKGGQSGPLQIENTQEFTDLSEGIHTLIVRSVDLAGNVSEPVSYTWTVSRATVINVSAATGTYGGTTTLQATLTRQGDGSALEGRTVSFFIDGTASGTAVTDSDGQAILVNVSLAGLNAGTHSIEVTFAGDDTHNAADGSGILVIGKADAIFVIAGYSGVYDGAAHGATGSVTGVNGEILSELHLGGTFTNAPGGMVEWSFTDTTGNYNDAGGIVAVTITKATPTVSVTGGSFIYNGQTRTATGSVIGVGGVILGTPTFTYSYLDNENRVVILSGPPVEPGIYTVTASFSGNNNYFAASTETEITIIFEARTLTDLSKAFKAGRTIPIKLQLLDANGNNVSSSEISVAAIRLERINADGSRTQVELQDAGNANRGNLFRYDASLGGYIFNLSTKGLSAGTYDFTWMAEQDPTERRLRFHLS